ncbi:phage holin, lambda family [Muribacter muris]|uniref:Phage holin, lambda family n=1 Tax=Muribacter muris TaxID=67855 RepID=A0A4Y9JV52_9PAST|nr:phage holin, lambda family [Muribacter muris]MBF0785778.1 phage holin, lambda family [Muribacter muris]MBF0828250.1 phage holin, lambda family [Muribacter muris]TFV08600.1 phage holin, lambda family [Muribacter muris]
MPDKTPDIWAIIYARIATHDIVICGVLVAFFSSLFKSFLYDKKDTWRRVLVEACLCSLIVYSVNPMLKHYGLPNELIIPIGTVIGMFGTSIIRQIIFKYLRKKGVMPDDQL